MIAAPLVDACAVPHHCPNEYKPAMLIAAGLRYGLCTDYAGAQSIEVPSFPILQAGRENACADGNNQLRVPTSLARRSETAMRPQMLDCGT